MAKTSQVRKIRSLKEATAIVQHVAQLNAQANALQDIATPKQRAFIDDPAKLKAALCTRRAGKSYGAGIYLFQEALSNPGCTCLFIGLTRQSAKQISVRDVIVQIAKKAGIKVHFNAGELSIKFANGSIIYIHGGNASDEQKEKLLGQKYQLVVIDECASFTRDLNDFVFNLLPAVASMDGTICLIGTPGNSKNFFYRCTTGDHDKGDVIGWSVHKWTYKDNPFEAAQQQNVVDRLIANDPLIVETPRFRQYWLGEWTVDDTHLIFQFDRTRNTVDRLPDLHPSDSWTYVMGVDLGWTAESAWVVVAYCRFDPALYVVDTYKRAQLITDKVAAKTQELLDHYSPMQAVVVDAGGLGRNIAEDMNARHGIHYEAAIKQGKFEKMQLLNSDLIMGRIKLLPSCSDLIDEWEELIWDERERTKGKFVVHSSCADHLSDAMLYAWGRARNYAASPRPESGPTVGSNEWAQRIWDRKLALDEASKDLPWWEKDAGVRPTIGDEVDPFDAF